MKRVFLFVMAGIMAAGMSFAQNAPVDKAAAKALKAEIKAATKTLKSAQSLLATQGDINQAKTLVDQALANEHTVGMADTWNTAGMVQKKFYDNENEKMYLKQPYNEDVFFSSLEQMFRYFNKCDELESQPNEKGKVAYKYRDINAQTLNEVRNNLISGGVTYFNKDNNQKAFDLFETYILSADYPMLKKFDYAATDSFLSQIAYYASLAGMKMENYDMALKYIDLAINDKEVGDQAMTYKCMSLASKGDTLQWVETLKQGVELYPSKDYFYSNLISYYNNNNQNAELLAFANEMISKTDLPIFYFVRGFLKQNEKDYEGAIKEYQLTLEKDPNYSGALRNQAICYCQLAQDKSDSLTGLNMKSKEYKDGMETVKDFYTKALPLYEKLRSVDDGSDPEVKTAWQSGLYTCYYMLNMEKEFEAIEKEMGM